MHLMRGTSKTFLAYAAVGFIGCFSRLTFAQIEYEYITPREHAWFSAVNLTSVPNIPLREIGSGQCDEKECDTVTTDRCFESCGNMPAPQDIYGCPRDHHWALTFDDGPSNYTLELLDYLAKEQIKATFCVMGAHVENNPDILKRIYKEGHQIASHTYSHPHLMSLSNEDIVYEIAATERLIEKVLGIRPNYIRPPFGEADERVKGIMRAMGYKVLLWNVDPTDYDVHMLRNVSKAIQGSFKMAISGTDTGLNLHEDPGFISLQHDLYKTSIDQIPEIVQLLKSKGYTFHTAAGCHFDNNPHNVTDPALAGEFAVVQNAVSEVGPEMPEAPPKEAPETEDVSPLEEANEGDSLDQAIEAQNNGQTTSAGLKAFSSSQKYLYSFVSLLPFIYYFA